mgnify:CR=1 FL=1
MAAFPRAMWYKGVRHDGTPVKELYWRCMPNSLQYLDTYTKCSYGNAGETMGHNKLIPLSDKEKEWLDQVNMQKVYAGEELEALEWLISVTDPAVLATSPIEYLRKQIEEK